MMQMIVIFTILATPLLLAKHQKFGAMTKTAVKLSFFVSLISLLISFSSHSWATEFCSSWLTLNTTSIPIVIKFDTYSLMFMTVAFFVSWSILEYAIWYMHSDPNLDTFMKYLLIFLMAMVTLVSAGNLLTLFIGWEGVGIMSYLLIGWFHGRDDAAVAAMQAILYNRMGDMGYVVAFCWAIKEFMSTNLNTTFSNQIPTLILIALIIAAASKSAQFGLHPWLTAAMEGPTPVSALLHSSTMVVAGIFLMIRISPSLIQNQTALTVCLCLGALSTFFASISALKQNDIKKIIAHSTSSQLGLMMVAIGIGQPHLAFFHICTHAFFKAMLFMCAGLLIHSLKDEQDIRKMGNLSHALPITTTSFSIGSLALMGTPFLSAFYSKDAIIESMGTSYVNSAALLLTLMATVFTSVYSVRLIYYVSMNNIWAINPMFVINEYYNSPGIKPIIRLAYGSVITGLFIFYTLIPYSPATHTMPLSTKIAAILATILALIMTYYLVDKSWERPNMFMNPMFMDPHHFFNATHRWTFMFLFDLVAQVIVYAIENLLLEKKASSPMEMQKLPLKQSKLSQSGMIKTYLASLLISIALGMVIVLLL